MTSPTAQQLSGWQEGGAGTVVGWFLRRRRRLSERQRTALVVTAYAILHTRGRAEVA